MEVGKEKGKTVGVRQAMKRREGGECTGTVYLYRDHSDEVHI